MYAQASAVPTRLTTDHRRHNNNQRSSTRTRTSVHLAQAGLDWTPAQRVWTHTRHVRCCRLRLCLLCSAPHTAAASLVFFGGSAEEGDGGEFCPSGDKPSTLPNLFFTAHCNHLRDNVARTSTGQQRIFGLCLRVRYPPPRSPAPIVPAVLNASTQ